MPRKGSKRKKTRTHIKNDEEVTKEKVPKSFVIHAGSVGSGVEQLALDVRRVLEPNTATRLRERKSNRLRDFVSMSGPLGVSHMLVFSQPDPDTIPDNDSEQLLNATTCNLRFIRLPRGPTLSFKVLRYSLASDLLRTARRPRAVGREFADAPMLILSGFAATEDKQVGLMKTVWQNLFPPIHVQSMPLSSARRVVLISYDAVRKTVDFRHYLISVRHVGVSKPIKKLLTGTTSATNSIATRNATRKRPSAGTSDESSASSASEESENEGSSVRRRARGKALLDLSRASDISDYVLRRHEAGFMSDSSAGTSSDGGSDTDMSSGDEGGGGISSADERKGKVRLAGEYVGRGNRGKHVTDSGSNKRAVRLEELGPRMELGLVKVEEGVAEGSVLFHEIVHKSVKEAAQLEQVHRQRRKEKEARKKEQEANVERKRKVSFAPSETGEGDDADDDEDQLESGAEDFDYDAEHGVQLESDDDDDDLPFADALQGDAPDDSDVDVDTDDDDEVDYEEDEAEMDSDGSDLTPIPYEPTPSPSPPPPPSLAATATTTKPMVQNKKNKGQQGPKKSALSFSHKGFAKFEAKPRKVLGVAKERMTKKQAAAASKKEKEVEAREQQKGPQPKFKRQKRK